jgi:hypothetical protein
VSALRQDSYLRAVRRVRHLADLIERAPQSPRDEATRTRAIHDLVHFAERFANHHRRGRGGY